MNLVVDSKNIYIYLNIDNTEHISGLRLKTYAFILHEMTSFESRHYRRILQKSNKMQKKNSFTTYMLLLVSSIYTDN